VTGYHNVTSVLNRFAVKAGVQPSMGSVGDAYDNAKCESFLATLECELLDRRKFQTKAEATWPSSSPSRAGITLPGAILPSAISHPSILKGAPK
jgi:transposase InsO family protein